MLTDHLEVDDYAEKDPKLVSVLSKKENRYLIAMSTMGLDWASGVPHVCQTFFRMLNISCDEDELTLSRYVNWNMGVKCLLRHRLSL